MAPSQPLVSVVIPSYERPDLLVRAVASARAQTFDAIEIIVVLDGSQPAAAAALSGIDDPRLRVITLPGHAGRGPATNAGVDAARADWIALLDDDDEWMPDKLRVQWQAAQSSHAALPIVACRFIARTAAGDQIWPHRLPQPGESFGDYLLVQSGLRGGEGMLLPSTLLIRRDLVVRERFGRLPQFIDLDWLLRVERRPGVAAVYVETRRPLAVWHLTPARRHISGSRDWRSAVGFLEAHRALLSPRAQVAFLLTQVSMAAARSRDWPVFFRLVLQSFRFGRPRPIDLGAHLAIWLTGRDTRVRLLNSFDRLRGRARRLAHREPPREPRVVS